MLFVGLSNAPCSTFCCVCFVAHVRGLGELRCRVVRFWLYLTWRGVGCRNCRARIHHIKSAWSWQVLGFKAPDRADRAIVMVYSLCCCCLVTYDQVLVSNYAINIHKSSTIMYTLEAKKTRHHCYATSSSSPASTSLLESNNPVSSLGTTVLSHAS